MDKGRDGQITGKGVEKRHEPTNKEEEIDINTKGERSNREGRGGWNRAGGRGQKDPEKHWAGGSWIIERVSRPPLSSTPPPPLEGTEPHLLQTRSSEDGAE